MSKMIGVKGDRRGGAFASRAYAIGKLIEEGGIQEIMTAMFYPPGTKTIVKRKKVV
jgi:hypothetical protein